MTRYPAARRPARKWREPCCCRTRIKIAPIKVEFATQPGRLHAYTRDEKTLSVQWAIQGRRAEHRASAESSREAYDRKYQPITGENELMGRMRARKIAGSAVRSRRLKFRR